MAVTEKKVKAVYEQLAAEHDKIGCRNDCPAKLLLEAIIYYGSKEFAMRYERGKLPADITDVFDKIAANV